MTASGERDGVTPVALRGALALFADATASPSSLTDQALADVAGRAVDRRFGSSVPVLYARQCHGRLACVYSSAEPLPAGPHLVGECDVLITGEAGVVLTVRTADCLPIALAAPGVVAMVHAGWRGLAADVLGSALARLANEFGAGAVSVEAAIGVGVGPCHYPVGPEVLRGLEQHDCREAWHADGRVDLAAWTVGRLRALGVGPGQVRVLRGCTACSSSHHSYRRDGAAAGRQWSAIVLTGGLRPSTPEAAIP
jgi:copper oxidase (laccase) domain-containing protein